MWFDDRWEENEETWRTDPAVQKNIQSLAPQAKLGTPWNDYPFESLLARCVGPPPK